jgi:hypothetical protein
MDSLMAIFRNGKVFADFDMMLRFLVMDWEIKTNIGWFQRV